MMNKKTEMIPYYPVNTIFFYHGEVVKVIEAKKGCDQCCLSFRCNHMTGMNCTPATREDRKNVCYQSSSFLIPKEHDILLYHNRAFAVVSSFTEGCALSNKCLHCSFNNKTGECKEPDSICCYSSGSDIYYKEVKNIWKMKKEENDKEKVIDLDDVILDIPEGYELDGEKSSIVLKKKEQEIKTWDDLVGNKKIGTSMCISKNSYIVSASADPDKLFNYTDRASFLDRGYAGQALALAQISQLMLYYGGPVTKMEWLDNTVKKYCIIYETEKADEKTYGLSVSRFDTTFFVLAFHTHKQASDFLDNNMELVRDFYQI